MVVEKRVMKRRSAPVEPDEDEAPRRSTGPSKKAVAKKQAPRKQAAPRADNGYEEDDDEGHELRAGWGAAQEMIDSASAYAANFIPGSKMTIIRFLQPKPYASYKRHWVERVGVGNRPYVCLESYGRPCPICNQTGDKPQAVVAFNIAVLSDDPDAADDPTGGATLKSWDAGVRPMKILKTYSEDPKIGPLDRPGLYFGISVTESKRRGQQKETIINPIRGRDMEEDYQTVPLTDEQQKRLLRKAYTNEIVQRPRASDLQDIADEMMDEDAAAGSSWS